MKVGFIGCGNMAQAMIGGIIKNGIFESKDIIASAKTNETLKKVEDNFHIAVTLDNKEVAEKAEVIFLTVKPVYYEGVIDEIKQYVDKSKIIVTVAPGQSLEKLGKLFGKEVKIIRTMPNTPALVGEGITAACKNEFITDEDLKYICDILKSFGKAEVVSESLMDVVVSVSGSSPAYVFMFIEAMADAAVADGMPRQQAYKFAAQAVLGSAKMVLETGMHPGALKDMVCSPAGTTIEAVSVLEKNGFRSSVIEAMRACTKKARG